MKLFSLPIVLLFLQISMINCAPPLTLEAGQPLDARGIFSDFYSQNMQVGSSGSTSEYDDIGEKFMHAVVGIAAAIGDTGIKSGQAILKEAGKEIAEAIRMRREVNYDNILNAL